MADSTTETTMMPPHQASADPIGTERPGWRRSRPRMVSVIGVAGWCSANPRSHHGMVRTGTNALLGTGLTEARKASVIMLLSGYVRNLAVTEADITAAVAASGLGEDEWMASYPRMLGQLADPRRFPALTAFIAAGVFDTADGPDDEFIFGLDRILDGVGMLVERVTP
jgi:Tetracyclin repressor-like, C-terminal domain